MKSATIFVLVGGILIFAFSTFSYAGVPQMMNYQGKITSPAGALVDTTIGMEFAIYDDSTGGNVLWADTLSSVDVEKGIFSVLLGSVNAIPDTVFDGSIRYLGVKVGDDPEMTPRKAIVSVGYAYRAEYADTAQYAHVAVSDGDWEPDTSGINIYRLTGNVGIGTPAPQERLHIVGGYQSTRIKLENSASGGKTFMLRTGVDPNGGFGISDQTALTEPFFIESGAATNLMYLKGSNVGIGTTSPNEQLELTGNFRLPPSTASVGVIKSGPNRFIHNFGTNNFFAGVNAGNFTLSSGGDNTGVGSNALKSLTTGYSNTAVGLGALNTNTTGYYNTAVGLGALSYNSTGNSNTAVGLGALSYNNTGNSNTAVGLNALWANTTGNYNTANGYEALYSNTTGVSNTANGYHALYSNTTGYTNTANGNEALYSNTTGNDNSANGYAALYLNTTGHYNTANGTRALYSNTTASSNTANGYEALRFNTTGTWNTANGYQALYANTTGGYNTANGYQALYSNTTGGSNTANGYLALYSNTIGAWNTAYGRSALLYNTEGCENTANGQASLYHNTIGNYNTADGYFALYTNTTGSCNTALGYKADVSVDSLTNATAIGYSAVVDASNKVRIGNSSVTVIEGQVDWSFPSDARLKTNVQKSPLGLDFILKLKPITYNSLAPGQEGITYTGLVAQDVEKLLDELGIEFSGLVKPGNEDDSYSLRYATFVMPLIRALQEQQEQIKALQQRIEELEKK